MSRNYHIKGATHRSGFTMIEVLTSAMVSGLVAATGAALVSAVSNASVLTRDVRAQKTEGHFTLNRIGQIIRQARGIGQVTTNSVTLWVEDKNGDDVMNLYEEGVISYDATNKQVRFDYLQPASGTTPATTLSTAAFTDIGQLNTAVATTPVADRKTEVWASDVESMTFKGYPYNTETRIVQTKFTVGTGSTATAFWGSASPRGSADYLFNSKAQAGPPAGSTRKARTQFSRWNGYADLTASAIPAI